MILHVNADYELGQTVYLRCRDEPERGIVTGYQIRPHGVLHIVTWADHGEHYHYGFELSDHFEPHYDHGAPGGAPASERG